MNKFLIYLVLWFLPAVCLAQESKPFEGYLYNEEFQIYIQLNAYDKNVSVPDQEIYGELPGYFGSKRDSRLWLITDSKLIHDNSLELSVINDYGSEDFTAKLTYNEDGTYTYKHIEGSTYKIVVKSKYVKIPKSIEFKKVEKKP